MNMIKLWMYILFMILISKVDIYIDKDKLVDLYIWFKVKKIIIIKKSLFFVFFVYYIV